MIFRKSHATFHMEILIDWKNALIDWLIEILINRLIRKPSYNYMRNTSSEHFSSALCSDFRNEKKLSDFQKRQENSLEICPFVFFYIKNGLWGSFSCAFAIRASNFSHSLARLRKKIWISCEKCETCENLEGVNYFWKVTFLLHFCV